MASLEAGKRLADRYVLLERLGDGGHAEVWAARDESTGQNVALKFMHLRSCSADDAMHVLRHEAQMAHRLQHPGVLRVDNPLRDGRLVFLPMAFAAGGDAAQLRGAAWRQVLPVLLQVAQVLEHAHSRGVVHRDIKPGNVLFDRGGAVLVTDFGTASRTGSTVAMSAGSPFSASPQQLHGDAATTADDIYGLGALAYELLTGYPPYYPDFDPQRVQSEDPPRPVAAHAAPDELLDLIQSMLVREPRERPDLQQVILSIEFFVDSVSPRLESDSAQIVEPAQIHTPVPKLARRTSAAIWWLVAAAGIGVAAFLLLPLLPPGSMTPDAAVVEAPPLAVAAAVIERDVQPVPMAAAPASAAETLADALKAATVALNAGQPALARAALQQALRLDPGNQRALQGMQQVASLDRLLLDFSAATRLEASGNLAGARAGYQALVAQSRSFAPAQDALVRVQTRQSAIEFERLLEQGAAALRQGKSGAAVAAYSRAAVLFPGDARVVDGQQRVAEVLRNQRNADDLARGAVLEDGEQWQAAVVHYETVLLRDELLFAQDGLTRSNRRAALDAELADYLARPERMSAPAVRVAAERAVARAEATSPHTPRLGSQIMQLKAALQRLTVRVRVAITSDNSTEVTVAAVGELGAFVLRELDLLPGRYTVIGRRDGFRDVRLELELAPGQHAASLSVKCTEQI